MANIFDYIKWRGDLNFQQSEFNEIDNLILARFSYFPFDTIIKPNELTTIAELNKRFQKENIEELHILQKEDIELFPAMAESIRFGDLKVSEYINKVEAEKEKQFSAITVSLPDNTIYVSFRGTDNTLVGWKEDFNMSFKSHVASQIDSIKYLEEVAKKYKKCIRVGGHSKGGNLAVYAAIYAKSEIQNRIIKVYNNDGPGFDTEITDTKEYKENIIKVHTFIPQSSVIGRLLNHEEKYTVLESAQTGIMQHDLYSWQLLGKQFIHLNEVTNGSEIVDKTIKTWLVNVTPEQREQFIDILFQILNKTEAKTLSELSSNWFTSARIILKTYKNIDEENKEIISKTLYSLFNITKSNLFESMPKLPEIRHKKKIKIAKNT